MSSMDPTTVGVQADFGQNYTFTIQNEVQNHYWAQESCTIHPIVVYLKEVDPVADKEKLVTKSFCFISDDINHDVEFVKLVFTKIVDYLKENHENVTHIEYNSDGCSGQYKNRSMFKFLCLHKKNFGITASFSFSATSHGKCPCDGICGICKREARKESLRRPDDNPIMTVYDLYAFMKSKDWKIIPRLITKEEVNTFRATNQDEDVRTVPGTRSFHYYTPLTESIIRCKTTSLDESYALTFDLTKKSKKEIFELGSLLTYVAFVADKDWFIGQIILRDEEDETVNIICMRKLMMNENENENNVKKNKSKKTYQFFEWPDKPVVQTVVFSNVLCSINNFIVMHDTYYKLKCNEVLNYFQKHCQLTN